jgi:Holliday junction resolvasome RuvABC DNA-binding subunit
MTLNEDIAGRLDEVARVLGEQGANPWRVQAYRRAANTLRALRIPVQDLFAERGLEGLEALPGVGQRIAHSIRDLLRYGRLPMLDRLIGESDPIALLTSVPGIGDGLAWRLHDELGIETLEALEQAAHDGRLERVEGLGAKRLAGIRDSLAHRLARVRDAVAPPPPAQEPRVAEILDVDREYREAAAADRLRTIAPRRFNPERKPWLPVLHTRRGTRHYTALFSNTARAHELGRTRDWVVLYYDGPNGERQCTVITAAHGSLAGRRIVRGREAECAGHYARAARARPAAAATGKKARILSWPGDSKVTVR